MRRIKRKYIRKKETPKDIREKIPNLKLFLIRNRKIVGIRDIKKIRIIFFFKGVIEVKCFVWRKKTRLSKKSDIIVEAAAPFIPYFGTNIIFKIILSITMNKVSANINLDLPIEKSKF